MGSNEIDTRLRKNAIRALFQAAGDVGCLGYKDYEHTMLRMAEDISKGGDARPYYEMQLRYYVES